MSTSREIAALRDAIGEALGEAWDDDSHHFEGEAAAILAMPEMQAIKQALRNVTEEDRYAFGGITEASYSLGARGLPDAVIDWVLS